jgi:hypothetical protein
MKAKMDFKAAERAFSKTLREYTRLSSKTAEDALNRTAKDVAIRAISKTPKADASKVRASLKASGLAYKLLKKTGLKREEIKKKAAALIRARVRSVGYIKAGWYKAARAFGGRGGTTRPGGLAAQGSGEKATSRKLTATLINKTRGAVEVSGQPLAAAIEEKRKDMMVYIARKLREGWGKRR